MSTFFEWIRQLLQGVKFWVIVNPWERCVRVRLGNRAAVLEPGLHFRFPWADTVTVVNTRLRITNSQSQTVTTLDGKTITIGTLVGYRISEPLEAMLNLQQPAESCSALVMSAVAEYVTDREAAEISAVDLEAFACAALVGAARGIDFDFVNVIEYACVPTVRLLQESTKPYTYHEGGGQHPNY